MNNKEVYTEILRLTYQFQKTIEQFGSQNKISSIEIDIALSKLRTIYELIKTIDISEKNETKKITKSNANTKHIKREIPQPAVIPNLLLIDQITVQPTENNTIDENIFEKNESIPENHIAETHNLDTMGSISNNEPLEKIENQPSPETTEPKKSAIVAEQYTTERKSLNDILSDIKSEKNLAAAIKEKPITNLSSAIGLNDKILFIKELFSGDSYKYTTTIEHFNSLTTLDDAMKYITDTLKWNVETPTFKKFFEFICRKFNTEK